MHHFQSLCRPQVHTFVGTDRWIWESQRKNSINVNPTGARVAPEIKSPQFDNTPRRRLHVYRNEPFHHQ